MLFIKNIKMGEFFDIVSKTYAYNENMYKNNSRWRIVECLFENNFASGFYKTQEDKIPKIIHQIWVGDKPLPSKYKERSETWKKFHPDWEYKLWTDKEVEELTDFPFKNLFYETPSFGARSDILRYWILYEYGGLYIDTDFECLKSFDEFRKFSFVISIGYSSVVELYTGLIMSTPKHFILQKILDNLKGVSSTQIHFDILSATGTYFVTNCFFNVVKGHEQDIVAMPTEYFYPYPNKYQVEGKPPLEYTTSKSYAIHYWEVSWVVKKGGRDWLQGEKFKDIADFVYTPFIKAPDDYYMYPNTFEPEKLKNKNIVYTHTIYLPKLLRIIEHLPQKFVIISHNHDVNIDASFKIPDNVVKLYAQNVCCKHPKIECIPIGLQNEIWNGKLFESKKIIISSLLKTPKKIKNLAYLCCLIKTNPEKRQLLYNLFDTKKWVTAEGGHRVVKVKQFLTNIYNHVFVFCPEGNGADTHRLWETLYLGSYPIVKRNVHTSFWENDFPICYVNKWENVTQEFLLCEKERLDKMVWDRSKLNFSYWKLKILKDLENEGWYNM